MRRLRIPAPVQLPLVLSDAPPPDVIWATLPDAARAAVLVLLARVIARGVLVADEEAPGE